jgi:hypothetical protein
MLVVPEDLTGFFQSCVKSPQKGVENHQIRERITEGTKNSGEREQTVR